MGTVSVTVEPVNDSPVAFDDLFVETNTASTLNVLGNDRDLEKDDLTISQVQTGTDTLGQLTLNSEQSAILYTPR